MDMHSMSLPSPQYFANKWVEAGLFNGNLKSCCQPLRRHFGIGLGGGVDPAEGAVDGFAGF